MNYYFSVNSLPFVYNCLFNVSHSIRDFTNYSNGLDIEVVSKDNSLKFIETIKKDIEITINHLYKQCQSYKIDHSVKVDANHRYNHKFKVQVFSE